MTGTTDLVVNGERVTVRADARTSLARVLREQLRCTSVKLACERGECGACTVLVGGVPRMACVTPARLVGREVVTAEGLGEEARDLQEAFADHGAFQCGFCTAGQLVHAVAVLRGPVPGGAELEPYVRRRLSGNICRCTGYNGLVDAVCAVAEARA
ncbi:(2Fe-2S)-binding protein [Nonomuraea glycinis]|uniref:(2Fe-2S)-binding protein n=1 Tax=Nonomuraea glycinis TaxID=2047744 RepID=A0A918ABM4_9ACTN|nr:(2Fe-2S)-binding protein [Nonomuraea glycinis]MCA2181252.1 (2Fe-2S)-binding protein [Nonomuraea glycinis]GGP13353.1 (2Fe-2S)-binding protein [Nonomuraea glycinis]